MNVPHAHIAHTYGFPKNFYFMSSQLSSRPKQTGPKLTNEPSVCFRTQQMSCDRSCDRFFFLTLCLSLYKSAAHLPDISPDVVAGCRERLEQSPCKELFNDCTK